MGLLDFVKERRRETVPHRTGQIGDGRRRRPRLPTTRKSRRPTTPPATRSSRYIKTQNLSATALVVTFDGATATATVYGVAPDQATMEKIVLCCGNVSGVAKVNNMMSVDQSAPEATYYTVVAGDNLSKISKASYGDPNKYMKIFEANKPMLSNPDKIYPGQVLRIPPA